jgi:hypothetical protein
MIIGPDPIIRTLLMPGIFFIMNFLFKARI